MLSMYIGLFFTSLGFIALRAFQQLNVQYDRYLWVPPVTALMAVCEVLALNAVFGTNWRIRWKNQA